jgi:hypothetical protein
VQRVFAIIELIRAVAAFMVAPVLLYAARQFAGGLDTGTRTALWICFVIAVAGAVGGVALYVLGGVRRPPAPNVEAWLTGQETGWDSPPLFARVKQKGAPEDACP